VMALAALSNSSAVAHIMSRRQGSLEFSALFLQYWANARNFFERNSSLVGLWDIGCMSSLLKDVLTTLAYRAHEPNWTKVQ
jgi:hypothetical protein